MDGNKIAIIKHCKKCRNFNEENFESFVGCWCKKKHKIPRFIENNDKTAENCDDYKRKILTIIK